MKSTYKLPRRNRHYTPWRMRYLQALFLIIDGIRNLFLIPFGYTSCLSANYANHILDVAMRKRKAEMQQKQ